MGWLWDGYGLAMGYTLAGYRLGLAIGYTFAGYGLAINWAWVDYGLGTGGYRLSISYV